MYHRVLSVVLYACIVLAATPAEWRSRAIYQVLTDRFARPDQSTTAPCNTASQVYCGGTWQGIIDKLDYIHNMGFTAIWISPITRQLRASWSRSSQFAADRAAAQNTAEGAAYHGYWQQNIDALNANFGSDSDLKALSAAVHARGMFLMVDVVVNHFGWSGNASTVDYSVFNPFDSQSYFHSYCPITDYDYSYNQTAVEDCWLGDNIVTLPDLNTTDPYVVSIYYSWIESLVSTYSIDGLRIDTVKHVDESFWPGFNTAAGVYCVGEVFDGDPAYTCPYQGYLDGILNYPLYYPLTAAFQSNSGSISALVNEVNEIKSLCKDSTLLGTFLENHDNPRFPSLTSDISLDMNAIAFTILADGIPIIYEGQEQHYSGGNTPYNREAVWLSDYSTTSPLYSFIASVNQIRNQAIYKDDNYLTYMAYPIYSDSSTIAMRKGFNGYQIVGVFSNLGANGSAYTLSLGNTGITSGDVVVEILQCASVTADGNGNIAVAMGQGLPKIFYPEVQLVGSGICNF